MLNLAKAESESDSVQIKVYEAQVKELKERREGLRNVIDANRNGQLDEDTRQERSNAKT